MRRTGCRQAGHQRNWGTLFRCDSSPGVQGHAHCLVCLKVILKPRTQSRHTRARGTEQGYAEPPLCAGNTRTHSHTRLTHPSPTPRAQVSLPLVAHVTPPAPS